MLGGRTNGTVSEDHPVGSLVGIRIAEATSNFKVKGVPISEGGKEVVDKGKPEEA